MNIKINDKEFTLKYNNKALFKIEKETGEGVISLFQNQKKLEQLNVIFIIVWAGIQEDISFDDFADQANIVDLNEMLPSIIESVGEAFNTGSKKK